MTKIFIVEDDQKIAELLNDYFIQINFDVSIFDRGDTVITEIKLTPPDIILLDLMLPGKDGVTIIREVRSFSNVPIIIITAKSDEIYRLLGLELGADDYICKPFSPREVVARVKAVMRRSNPGFSEIELSAGPISVNLSSHRVTIMSSELKLTPNEFIFLSVLISRPNWVFTRNDLISKIPKFDSNSYDRTVDSHIKNLRRKIDVLLPGNKFIKTIYGMGYSFIIPQPADALNENNGGL